jgi:uncharacterized caspase-like protein
VPFFTIPGFSQSQKEMVEGGVEHWFIPQPANGDSYLAKKFKEIYKVVNPKNVQPFGRSIALLVGVSKYHYLSPQLPSVRNDLDAMREFLLNKAGFDEVYVASDGIVDRDLIEKYVKGILPVKMHKNDRLLFYYSGHGGDNQGKTGYMLFGEAQKGQFYGKDVLAIDTLNDWSHELQIQHVLFILDSCASGLGIAAKADPNDSAKLLLQTLSGNGSRTALTAGTGDEATYAEDTHGKTGNSFFTKSLLNAFESRSLADSGTGFITVSDLFADIEKQMAVFRAANGKTTTPRISKLQEMDYRGTFVFLNPRASAARLTSDQAKALGVTLAAKGEGGGQADTGAGIIEVMSTGGGMLSIDSKEMGFIVAGDRKQFFQQAVGIHKVQVQGDEPKDVTVETGKITYVSFGVRSPIDHSGKVAVGALELVSTLQNPGEVFIDNYQVGRVEKNGKITITDLLVGSHDVRIDGPDESQKRVVNILQGQTTRIIVAPMPPTGLKAIVN